MTIPEWVRAGARDEDDTFSESFARYRNHFFDPTPGAPNAGGFTGLLPPLGTASGRPGPDWSLEPSEIPGQNYSYRDAREYLLKGLTEPGKTDREKNLAKAFYALGHVLHVLQDLAVPQHTRNDAHPLGSHYEKFTDDAARDRFAPYTLTYTGGPVPAFSSVRDLWVDMAKFSNRNFVSAGKDRNFRYNAGTWLPSRKYENPKPFGATEEVPIEQLPGISPEIVAWCGGNCLMRFIASKADDGDPVIPRAATFSILTEDLSRVPNAPAFDVSLNRYNFMGPERAHGLLIPRAVSYTAALFDYFFRGRIDLVVDPQNPAQLLVKNLGSEPMKGRFQIYYDDVSDGRGPVLDDSGKPLVWDTEVILANAPSAGVLLAGAEMAVARFAPPQVPAPKTPGEYMLVFKGEMGEEKPGEGAAGAVAGKLIRAPVYRGALYVAGLNAQNRVVTFKVDPAGLRVLNGPDANGQLRSTPVGWQFAGQKDIDPLFPVVNSFAKAVQPRLRRVKQPTFEAGGLGGMSHEIVALDLALNGGGFLAYAKDPDSGRLEWRGTGSVFRWTARSPDAAIGDFEFWVETHNSGLEGTLYWIRRYRPAPDQGLATTGGAMPLPIFPGIAFGGEDVNYVSYHGFRSGNLVVSPDGTKLSGFKTQTQEGQVFYWNTYDLNIALGAQPTASLAQTERLRANTSIPSPNNVSESSQSGPGDPPDQHSVSRTRMINNSEGSSAGRKFFVDYISGRLIAWRDRTQHVSVDEFIEDRTHDVDYDPDWTCPQTRTTDVVQFLRFARKAISTTTVAFDNPAQGDTPIVSVFKDIAKKLFNNAPVNFTRNFSSRQIDSFPCSGPQIIGTPTVVDNLVHDSDAQDPNPSFSGYTLSFTLNGTYEGSILLNWARGYIGVNPPPGTAYFIGGQRLSASSASGFVADASPLGEIFAASVDKSVIVYRPLASNGMPSTLDIPPHIVKLIAALWL
jgi:hypothetical protein